jgi:hypothetical protein
MMVSEHMEVIVPGKARISGQFASVTATTLDRLIMGFKPYSTEGNGGLRFAAIETGGGNVFRALKAILFGSFGKKYVSGVHTRRGDEIRIEGSDPVTLDGEMYTPLPGKPILLKGDKTLTFVQL